MKQIEEEIKEETKKQRRKRKRGEEKKKEEGRPRVEAGKKKNENQEIKRRKWRNCPWVQ
jgi:hypothetical protein